MAFDAERVALKPYKAASAALTRQSLPTPKVAIKDERGEEYFYSLQFCERLIDGVPESKRDTDPVIRQAFEAVEEHHRVRLENKKLCTHLRVDELEAAWSSACDDRTEAANTLMECPAPDLAAVIQKIDMLHDEVDSCNLLIDVRNDLRRLNGGGAA
ncbi:hypothetical protein [Sphingosinicella sp.]|uniref:hypothetical protein n=1 Tax=Sphingosinicella sp. TaxID=1917971 RepID=UPI0017F51613|nr:hypothetical protein [Sphingosinicella sp.]MBA4757748.1 hypothetical protein [Sphingosinicella sp.]